VVLVAGEIGAGKTTWVRGACRALGVRQRVTSPTFVLVHRYRGRLAVVHLDLHRLAGIEAEEPGMIEDELDPAGVAFVEWPEHGAGALERPALRVALTHLGGDRRRIELDEPGG
jgi:tRNA threonylcarbamoyladenosine biosynthesis protein TsaE